MKNKLLFQVIVITILLAAFLLTGCEGGTQSSDITGGEDPAQTNKDNTVAEQNISIVVTPPDGWSPVEGSVLPVQYLNGTASFMVKVENFSGDTLDNIVEEAKSSFSGTFDHVQYLGDIEAITVDGKDARKLQFTCEISSMQMKYEYVYLIVSGDVYAITFGDLSDQFDRLASDYETILADIKFD